MITAIYPGTFDPITNGHIDIAVRSARLFHKVVIGVFDFPKKDLLFFFGRAGCARTGGCGTAQNISVEPYTELTVDFARKMWCPGTGQGASGVSGDFEFEFANGHDE